MSKDDFYASKVFDFSWIFENQWVFEDFEVLGAEKPSDLNIFSNTIYHFYGIHNNNHRNVFLIKKIPTTT